MKVPDISTENRFSIFAVLSLLLGILSLFVTPLSILAIASGIAGLVQIARTPDLKFRKPTKIMAIIGITLGSAMVIFLIIDLIMMRGIFKTLGELRNDLITYFGNKSKDIIGNVSDLTNMTGGLEGLN